MASWSDQTKKDTSLNHADSGPSSVPSLAAIMQEQEQEQKRSKHRKPRNKSGMVFKGGWNSFASQQSAQSVGSAMNEDRHTQPKSSSYTYTPTLATSGISSTSSLGATSKPFTSSRVHYQTPTAVTGSVQSSTGKTLKSSTGTKVINVRKQSLRTLGYKDLVDWLQNSGHVYIGRNMTHYVPGVVGSKWGNPFKMTKGMTRDSCCAQYKAYIKSDTKIQANGKTLIQSLGELKGKTLGCWCHPEMCHGHMLVQLIEENCV